MLCWVNSNSGIQLRYGYEGLIEIHPNPIGGLHGVSTAEKNQANGAEQNQAGVGVEGREETHPPRRRWPRFRSRGGRVIQEALMVLLAWGSADRASRRRRAFDCFSR
jgi:hypothetical protein